MLFTVDLGPDHDQSDGSVDVSFTTQDGTATAADNDYIPTSGTLHFASGQSSATIPVTVVGDNKKEKDETFYVRISSPDGSVQIEGDGKSRVVIENDDH